MKDGATLRVGFSRMLSMIHGSVIGVIAVKFGIVCE